MDKVYVEELLKDIDKCSSLEERTHLLTVFVTELAKSDAENKESISDLKETLTLSAKVAEAFTESLSVTANKFSEIDECLLVMSRQSLSTAKSMTSRTEDVTDIYNKISNVHKSLMKVNDDISMIMHHINKLYDK